MMNWPVLIGILLLIVVIGYRVWMRMGVEQVSVHEVRSRLAAREPMLIVDVREPHEFRQGHLSGAVNIPAGELAGRAAGLDREAEIILVCASGERSLTAYHQLKRQGFTGMRNLEGGMRRWPWETV